MNDYFEEVFEKQILMKTYKHELSTLNIYKY